MALERETVLRTALRLLDEVGLDGLSLRRLAKELGVQAPALYWHFTNKQDLLDHLAVFAREEAGVSLEGTPKTGQAWDEWLAEGMRTLRRGMLKHRDGARLAAGNRPVREAWPDIERTLSMLVEAGFAPADAVRAVLVLGHYVSGFVLDEQRVSEREDDPLLTFDPADFPILAAGGAAVLDQDALFEYGLQRMLDGMRAHLAVTKADPDRAD
ncbi:TetR/AcrR family transcriptional regulator C-terminal domain-containing protein [Actinoallomurus spadix]|uniref:TetR/AcrR family transcriptional regulator C-terminal domain-containing protein n=1 Tax=Actinoallomurus spadix TaxID=79912 RepID=A0ABP3GJW0_9ACTN|nr:TetR/AcrR family transcriptional regulator C-terminal domain-containing protein [Actinoallomurus spadix]MCO5986492.1 TetR/AcrR family transcriptional regulator C-terminal domain-containing protein [Actinoallomurus spadix]